MVVPSSCRQRSDQTICKDQILIDLAHVSYTVSELFTNAIRSKMEVSVRDNNVDQAMRALKKKLQREGVFREMRLKEYFEKPSVRKAREKKEAISRQRKLARKKAAREGL